jgi:hypothetical protein
MKIQEVEKNLASHRTTLWACCKIQRWLCRDGDIWTMLENMSQSLLSTEGQDDESE